MSQVTLPYNALLTVARRPKLSGLPLPDALAGYTLS
jgi:hypothetical protein